MKKNDNMKQAMYSMFGVGQDMTAVKAAEAPTRHPEPDREVWPEPAAIQLAVSFLAEGTAFEGALNAKGNVEISGEFKGSIATEGMVRLRSDIQSSIDAGSLELSGCVLTGDVVVDGSVTVDECSKILGNISANQLHCAGEVVGDLKIADSVRLESKARVSGNIVAGAISVDKGAVISGNVQIKTHGEIKN